MGDLAGLSESDADELLAVQFAESKEREAKERAAGYGKCRQCGRRFY